MRPALALCRLLLPIWLLGCTDPLSEPECRSLLDRYTEFLVRESHPEMLPADIEERKARAFKLAKDDPQYEFDRCAEEISRSQFNCAMKAPSVDTIEQCLIL